MRKLRTTDRTRQKQLIQTLTVMQSLQGQVTTLQGQVTALQGQVTALQGQQGPARGLAQPELQKTENVKPCRDLGCCGLEHPSLALRRPEQAPTPPRLDYVPGPEHANERLLLSDHPDAEEAHPLLSHLTMSWSPILERIRRRMNDEDPAEDPINKEDDGDDE
ncbi:hypothetical protein Tco_1237443 [Tanacetum coccineum]